MADLPPQLAPERVEPRSEAFAPGKLTDSQRRARAVVCELAASWARLALEAAKTQRTNEARAKAGVSPLPWLFDVGVKRYAQVVLLDGARGTGKTSTLLAIRKLWSQALAEDHSALDSNATEDPRPLEDEERALVPPEFQVVPLPILDLHPHPSRQSLLGVLLGLFEQLHAMLAETGAPDHVPPYLPPSVRGVEDRLQCASAEAFKAVAAWSGHTMERSANLQEDVYWRDLRDETARVSRMPEHFQKYVDALVDAWQERSARRKPPMFAILVDDADMNPRRSVELLELIRSLSHPRVFFVLTGDSSLFQLVLKHHLYGTVRSLGKAIDGDDRHLVSDRDLDEMRKLAMDSFDRIIPPTQRLAIDESIAGLWPPADSKGEPMAQLRACLAKTKSSANSLLGLDEFFRAPDEGPGALRFAHALPRRLRRLLDLTAYIRAQGDPPPQDKILYYWWLALLRYEGEERIEMTSALMKAVENNDVRISFAYGVVLRWKQNTQRTGSVKLEGRTLSIHDHTLFEVSYRAGTSKAAYPLPPALADMLQLLCDTISYRTPTIAQRAPLQKFGLLKTVWPGPLNEVALAWPLPPWRCFTTYLRFAEAWRQLAVSSLIPPIEDRIARAYLSAVYYAPLDRGPHGGAPEDVPLLEWKDLWQLAGTTPGSGASEADSTDAWFGSDWLTLFAPEFGLTPAVIDEALRDRRVSDESRKKLAAESEGRCADLKRQGIAVPSSKSFAQFIQPPAPRLKE